MSNRDLKNILLLILLPILHVGVFSRFNFFGYINPFFYVIFVFIFPLQRSKALLLLYSFFLGLFIDILDNSGGVHTFSLVFVAFFRLPLLRLLRGNSDFNFDQPNARYLSFSLLLIWVGMLTFIHHILVFLLEQFSFARFGTILLKTFITSVFSTILIIFGLRIFLRKKSHAK